MDHLKEAPLTLVLIRPRHQGAEGQGCFWSLQTWGFGGSCGAEAQVVVAVRRRVRVAVGGPAVAGRVVETAAAVHPVRALSLKHTVPSGSAIAATFSAPPPSPPDRRPGTPGSEKRFLSNLRGCCCALSVIAFSKFGGPWKGCRRRRKRHS